MENKEKQTEAQRFDVAVRKLMSVSHGEFKRREEEWKKQRKAKGYKRVKA